MTWLSLLIPHSLQLEEGMKVSFVLLVLLRHILPMQAHRHRVLSLKKVDHDECGRKRGTL